MATAYIPATGQWRRMSQSTKGKPYCTPSKVAASIHCGPASSISFLSLSLAYCSKYPGFFHGYGVYPGYWTVAEDGRLQYDKATADMKEPLAKLAPWIFGGVVAKALLAV